MTVRFDVVKAMILLWHCTVW